MSTASAPEAMHAAQYQCIFNRTAGPCIFHRPWMCSLEMLTNLFKYKDGRGGNQVAQDDLSPEYGSRINGDSVWSAIWWTTVGCEKEQPKSRHPIWIGVSGRSNLLAGFENKDRHKNGMVNFQVADGYLQISYAWFRLRPPATRLHSPVCADPIDVFGKVIGEEYRDATEAVHVPVDGRTKIAVINV